MGNAAFEEYDEWDLSPLRIPVRSALFSLEPIGVRTPWVESLTSYIARLANAHCVFPGVLMEKVVVPLVPGYSPQEAQHYLFRNDGNKSNLLNATGPRALYAVGALEKLTRRTDLHALTLLTWAEVLPLRGLIRLTKAWCPACYEEWRVAGKDIYDPLLWVFEEISACTRHQQSLTRNCPYRDCARSLPALTWRSRPGYCTYCHRWLGKPLEASQLVGSTLNEAELVWQCWITQALGMLLVIAPTVSSPPKRQKVSESIISLVNQIAGGKIAAFARTLGMSSQIVHYWYHGGRIPEIDILLRLCFLLELSPVDLLCSDANTLCPHVRDMSSLRLPALKRRVKTEIDRESIHQFLEEIVSRNEDPPPSIPEVAHRFGFNLHKIYLLYECHRDACSIITARHWAYLRRRKESRMQGYREEIRQVALQLQTQGVSLTQKHIAPHMTQPGILRDPKVRELLREVCLELETSDGEKSL
jgi:hypothetical protein